MDEWVSALRGGAVEVAWDRFIDRYRRLIFAAIRHYVQDYDEVMDVFARVCEALRENDLRRLRQYLDQPSHSARFSTWLVTVVRNLTIDWYRHRDGRRRLSSLAESLPPLGRQIFEHVILGRCGHVEAFETICAKDPPGPTFRQFLGELRQTYKAVTDGRRGRLLSELSPPPPDPEEKANPAEAHDRREWLNRVLAGLDPDDRLALTLYIVDELPAARIATMLGLPNAKAVYNRVYRALDLVRGDLEKAGLKPGDL
ncbi:MAG: RNA polymerase sigma factor [Gemmatimonadales bacterium]